MQIEIKLDENCKEPKIIVVGLFVGCDGSQGRIVGTETGFQYG